MLTNDDWYSPYGYFVPKDRRTDEQKDQDMYDFYDIFGYIKPQRRINKPAFDGETKAENGT